MVDKLSNLSDDYIDSKISDLTAQYQELLNLKYVYEQEKSFRKYFTSIYNSIYSTLEKKIGSFLRKSSKQIDLDRARWFAEYKKDIYPENAKDLSELLSILTSSTVEIKLSEAESLVKRISKYEFGIYIYNTVGETNSCVMCKKIEYNAPELVFITEESDGDAISHGYRETKKTSIVVDKPVESLLEYTLKLDHKRVQDYMNILKLKINEIKIDPDDIKKAQNEIDSIQRKMEIIKDLLSRPQLSSGKICKECKEKPDYERLKETVYSRVVQADWLVLE